MCNQYHVIRTLPVLLFSALFFLKFIVVSFVFVFKFTYHYHRVETKLQLKNTISNYLYAEKVQNLNVKHVGKRINN